MISTKTNDMIFPETLESFKIHIDSDKFTNQEALKIAEYLREYDIKEIFEFILDNKGNIPVLDCEIGKKSNKTYNLFVKSIDFETLSLNLTLEGGFYYYQKDLCNEKLSAIFAKSALIEDLVNVIKRHKKNSVII